MTDGDIPDLTSYIDSDGLFDEIAPFIGSAYANIGLGFAGFHFEIDYDNELININANLLAAFLQNAVDRLVSVEGNLSTLTGRVSTLES